MELSTDLKNSMELSTGLENSIELLTCCVCGNLIAILRCGVCTVLFKQIHTCKVLKPAYWYGILIDNSNYLPTFISQFIKKTVHRPNILYSIIHYVWKNCTKGRTYIPLERGTKHRGRSTWPTRMLCAELILRECDGRNLSKLFVINMLLLWLLLFLLRFLMSFAKLFAIEFT